MNTEDRRIIARLLRVVEADKSVDESPRTGTTELTRERDAALDSVSDSDLQRARELAGRCE